MSRSKVVRASELAQVLASGDPRTWRTLRARHLPGPDGRCTECRSSRYPAERWPCTLRTIADQAAALVGTNLAVHRADPASDTCAPRR